MNYIVIAENDRFRVQRPDGTLTKGRFHTEQQANDWIKNNQPAYHRQALLEASRRIPDIYSFPFMHSDRRE